MAEKEIDVLATEEYEIEMEEVLPPVVTEGGTMNHALLNNREKPNQHPIIAIEGLREELDDIRALKENFSNKYGHANYYMWDDGGGEIDERVGYFVSACDGDCSKITMCNRGTVLGVSVDTAAFIGNRADAVRTKCNSCGNIVDGHWTTCTNPECESKNVDYIRKVEYGLVATSGVVTVRCESDVVKGDYVMPNANGVAEKVDSTYGYQVIEVDNQLGVSYAAIDLDATTSSVYGLGIEVDELSNRVAVNEKNIVSAINVANQAYNKSQEAATSSSVSEEAVREALEAILKSEEKIEEFEKVIESSNATSVQARAIAESAVTEAERIRTEAVEVADKAWKDTNDLIKTLEPITTWEDPNGTGISGADYLATQMNNGIATSYDVKVVDTKTDKAMSAIIRNGKELQSLMTVIDKYSVGPYSQAYGFTLEQAKSVLEIGMIYVPTSHKNMSTGSEYHKEEYTYKVDGATKTYTRWFTPGYLYRWDNIPNDEIGVGWLTIGNNVTNTVEDYSNADNQVVPDVSPWVFFSGEEPNISDTWEYGYWYTDADEIKDKDGNIGAYEPYTLYKWEKPENEEGYWFAVATLAGNSLNRSVSQIRQDANSIELSVTDMKGDVATSKQWISDNDANIQDVVSWKGDNSEAIATTIQSASDSEAYIAQIASVKNEDGTINAAASIVTAVTEDESSIALLADNITLDASQIVLNGETFFVDENGESTTIDGNHITTGTITAEHLEADFIKSIEISADKITSGTLDASKVTVLNLDASQITTGELDADRINVEDLNAFGATIGGWNIDEDRVYKAGIGLSSNTSKYLRPSLVKEWTDSPIRFYAGTLSETMDSQKTKTFSFVPTEKGKLLTQAFEENHRIANAKCETETVTHASDTSKLIDITLTKNELLYEGETEVDLFPAWVLADHILDGTLIAEEFYLVGSGVGVGLTITYIGSGKVKITAQKFATTTDPLTLSVSIRVAGSYSFTETLDIDVSFADKIITVNFVPQTTEKYNIDIEYHRDENSSLQKFSVLADGSLYASAAKIEGNITATSGRIGGCSIEDGVLQIKNANADNLEFKRGMVGDWYLGKTDIPISGTASLRDVYALYSREMTEEKGGRTYTYQVYLTPKGVYVCGRYDTSSESAVPYHSNKTWLDICES